ncbi:MAG: hypothetical protein IJB92_00140 [Clostridia bacterium]|nr:hypothetical protein [Clostridia bacterium]
MKYDFTKKAAAVFLSAALLAAPIKGFAKEITFEVIPGVEWKLTVPDEFFSAYEAAPGESMNPEITLSPIPTAIPLPTQAPEITPEPTKTASPALTPKPTASPAPTANTSAPSAVETQMLSWVNAERKSEGLSAYGLDPTLTKLARLKAQDMIDNSYFAHSSPTYGSAAQMLKSFGYSYRACGENIARYGDVYKAHVGLMSSTGHRQNIMSKSFNKIGIGIVRAQNGAYYIVQIFAR